MIEENKRAYKDFVIARIETALLRLRNNPAYIHRCRKQEKSEKKIDKLLHKLKKHERTAIRRYYEGEMVKQNFELDETYLQGMRDCFQIFSFLNVFDTEVHFYE